MLSVIQDVCVRSHSSRSGVKKKKRKKTLFYSLITKYHVCSGKSNNLNTETMMQLAYGILKEEAVC